MRFVALVGLERSLHPVMAPAYWTKPNGWISIRANSRPSLRQRHSVAGSKLTTQASSEIVLQTSSPHQALLPLAYAHSPARSVHTVQHFSNVIFSPETVALGGLLERIRDIKDKVKCLKGSIGLRKDALGVVRLDNLVLDWALDVSKQESNACVIGFPC